MTKLVVNRSSLETVVLSSVDSSKTYVGYARGIAQRLYAPSDFSYRSRYNEYTKRINEIYNELSDMSSWINKSINLCNAVENELSGGVSLLPTNSVEKQREIIK